MTTHNQSIGAQGESLAARYLEAQGATILDRNSRTRLGELDLVALDGDIVVAVEVKTRSGTGYGDPLEAITVRKLARLKALIAEWITARPEIRAGGLRVDAIGVTMRKDAEPRIDHLRGIS